MAQKQSGFPRNLGDPAVSTGSFGVWESPLNVLPAHRRCVSWAVGAKARRTEWYRQATATERGGTDGGKSQRFIVPVIQGNLYRGDPGREGSASSRNFGQATRPGLRTWSTVSTKWPRIAGRKVKP
jgi:hypothetical protein